MLFNYFIKKNSSAALNLGLGFSAVFYLGFSAVFYLGFSAVFNLGLGSFQGAFFCVLDIVLAFWRIGSLVVLAGNTP